jgi:hypothetical protein
MKKQYKSDLDWWQEKLTDYNYLDSLSDEEFKRLVLSCLLCIVNAIEDDE